MDDLISRQAAIEIVDDIDTWTAGWRYYAIEKIRALPSAQPERKTGKWDTECRTIHGHKFPVFACSECGKESIDEYNFCPNCGAEMNEVEE